nr:PaaI family thioesterase [Bacillus haynesii]
MTGEIPDSPVAQILGFKVIEVEEDRVVIELEASKRLHNPMGTLHGGILCDIADAAIGLLLPAIKRNIGRTKVMCIQSFSCGGGQILPSNQRLHTAFYAINI